MTLIQVSRSSCESALRCTIFLSLKYINIIMRPLTSSLIRRRKLEKGRKEKRSEKEKKKKKKNNKEKEKEKKKGKE